MTKLAHITSRPNHAVGDRVLGLCGKEFKVKVLWADLPKSKPICRECVDTSLDALTQADKIIESVRSRVRRLLVTTEILSETLNEDTILDIITENDLALQDELAQRAREAAEAEKTKVTCTCTWTSPEIFTEDPNCPIHGGELDAIGVEISEDKAIGVEDVQLPEEDVKPEVQE